MRKITMMAAVLMLVFGTGCTHFSGFLTSMFSRTRLAGVRTNPPSENCVFVYSRRPAKVGSEIPFNGMACYCILNVLSEDYRPVILMVELHEDNEDYCFKRIIDETTAGSDDNTE